MFKQSLAVLVGSLLAAWVFAQDVELREGHPDTYVVVEGDTLWDISGRFLTRPWLWPEIWQANPQIANPHLIYPGDVINLVYIDGQPRLMVDRAPGGTVKLSPGVRRQPLDTAIKAVPLRDIQQFLERPRVMSEEERSDAPYIVAVEENRLLAMHGQVAYVRGLDNYAVGDEFVIVRPNHVYREVPTNYPWNQADRRERVADSWSSERGLFLGDMLHQIFKNRAYHDHVEVLGYEAFEIGRGQVTREGDPATLLISHVAIEIKPGDLVVREDAVPMDLSFFPRPPQRVPENMRVLAFNDALNVVGPNQVVALNRGSRDGVENGHVYSIFTPGENIRDEVRHPQGDLRAFFRPSRSRVTLPEEFIGHVMVFRTFDRISYGLIMSGIRPVHLYDVLRAPLD